MKHLSLIEHERVWLAGEGQTTGLGTDGCQYIEPRHYRRLQRFDEKQSKHEEGKQVFSFHSRWIKACNWVGVVQVKGLCVEILPKIVPQSLSEVNNEKSARELVWMCRRNLLYMLSIGREPLFRERDLASLETRVAPLSEKLIEIFATRLQEVLLEGLPHHYVRREENLRRLKGKLNFPKHILKNSTNRARFHVTYQEFVPDNLMNRIFKACCRILLRNSSRPRTQEKLRHCLLLLDDVADAHIVLEDFKRVTMNRQNERFHEVFNFCMLIISQQSPTAGSRKTDTFTLLFDMNAVFEEFIAAFYVKKVLPLYRNNCPDLHLHPQGKGASRRYLLSYHDASSRHVMLKPDLLFAEESDTSAVAKYTVADTKWKALPLSGGKPKVSREDYYQMYAYAHRYGACRNVLLFPQTADRAGQDEMHEFRFLERDDELTDLRMLVCFADLHKDLRKDWQQLAAQLAAVVEVGHDQTP